jgi:hypothetical protein
VRWISNVVGAFLLLRIFRILPVQLGSLNRRVEDVLSGVSSLIHDPSIDQIVSALIIPIGVLIVHWSSPGERVWGGRRSGSHRVIGESAPSRPHAFPASCRPQGTFQYRSGSAG